jgi:hypothetical protein
LSREHLTFPLRGEKREGRSKVFTRRITTIAPHRPQFTMYEMKDVESNCGVPGYRSRPKYQVGGRSPLCKKARNKIFSPPTFLSLLIQGRQGRILPPKPLLLTTTRDILTYNELDHSLPGCVPGCLPACRCQLTSTTITTAGLEKRKNIGLVIWTDFLSVAQ